MKWQVFVRFGINNTSPDANNRTNADVVAFTNQRRSELETAGLRKQGQRKTATYRGEMTTRAEVTGVCDALRSLIKELGDLEAGTKQARLDNIWLMINREDDGGADLTDRDADDTDMP